MKHRKPRSAAQKRATAKLVAMAKHRRAAPKAKRAAKRTTKRAARVVTIMSNPARKVHRKKYRRNPISLGSATGMIKPALIGAAGATLVNSGLGFVMPYLPAALATGVPLLATRAAAAIGLGWLGNKVGLRGDTAKRMAEGALTVTLHDALTQVANSAGFSMLSGVGAYMPRRPGMAGLRAYMPQPGAATPTLPAPRNVVPMTPPAIRNKMSGFSF